MSYPEVKEEVGWQGMADGSIDTIVENWGHPDLVKKYVDEQRGRRGRRRDRQRGDDRLVRAAVDGGQYPDIADCENLNKYADMFKTSESGGKGQLLDGDPSYVTNDEALVKNLDLNYEVVVGGSEAALLESFKKRGGEQDAAAGLLLHAAVVRRGRRQSTRREGPGADRTRACRTPTAATPTRPRSPATTRRTT